MIVLWFGQLLFSETQPNRKGSFMAEQRGRLSLHGQDQQTGGHHFILHRTERGYLHLSIYTHNDFSLSWFRTTGPRNHRQHSHSCRLCHFLAAHPQHWQLWQVHCLLQPHGPSATIHHVHLQGPSFRNRCFMAYSYAYTVLSGIKPSVSTEIA